MLRSYRDGPLQWPWCLFVAGILSFSFASECNLDQAPNCFRARGLVILLLGPAFISDLGTGGSRSANAQRSASGFFFILAANSTILRLLQHETGRRSDRGASRPPSAKMAPRPASAVTDPAVASVAFRGRSFVGNLSYYGDLTFIHRLSTRDAADGEKRADTGSNPSHGGIPSPRLTA